MLPGAAFVSDEAQAIAPGRQPGQLGGVRTRAARGEEELFVPFAVEAEHVPLRAAVPVVTLRLTQNDPTTAHQRQVSEGPRPHGVPDAADTIAEPSLQAIQAALRHVGAERPALTGADLDHERRIQPAAFERDEYRVRLRQDPHPGLGNGLPCAVNDPST